jgi:hypothetical protein
LLKHLTHGRGFNETWRSWMQSAQHIGHPINQDAACVVLQYADDTLIVMKGELWVVQELENILDQFTVATRLQITFAKSIVVPIHMDNESMILSNKALLF